MASPLDLLNADLNLATLDQIITSDLPTATNRLGRVNTTIAGWQGIVDEAIADVNEDVAAVDAAATAALADIAETAAEIPEALSLVGTGIPFNTDISTIPTGGLIAGNWAVDLDSGNQFIWAFLGAVGYWWPMNPSYGTESHQALPERNGPSRHIASDIDMGGGNSLANLADVDSTVSIAGVAAKDLAYQRRVDIRLFGVLLNGSDDGPKLRIALASGLPLYFPPDKTITVNFDPASAFDDGGVTRYSRCIAIPSNSDLMFGPNFKIKGANGLQSWTRVVVMENIENIKIYGTMLVDGNVENIGTPNNEHMHSIFMFNVNNLEADTLRGINSRGDNIFIGGSDEITFSDNIRIRSVIGMTAGRKNLVLHMADNVHIDFANLDNSAGGAAIYGGTPDDTDKHCLDLEPDVFTGSKVFKQYIGNLRTFGLGNDFTAGTTPTVADAWQLTIGTASCRQSGPISGSVKAWLQYGVTINILGDLSIEDCSGVDEPVFLQYAARLNVGGEMRINGSCVDSAKSMLFATAAGGDANTPKIKARELMITSSNGGAAMLRSCHLDAKLLQMSAPAYGLISGDNVATEANKAVVNIDKMTTVDTGTTYVCFIDTPVLAAPYFTVGEVTCLDSRGDKADAIFQVASGNSLNLSINNVTQTSGIPLVNWVGADKYFKSSAYRYICQGTPEGMIAAPVGSTASNITGGAGTAFYVKETNTTNLGWTAK